MDHYLNFGLAVLLLVLSLVWCHEARVSGLSVLTRLGRAMLVLFSVMGVATVAGPTAQEAFGIPIADWADMWSIPVIVAGIRGALVVLFAAGIYASIRSRRRNVKET